MPIATPLLVMPILQVLFILMIVFCRMTFFPQNIKSLRAFQIAHHVSIVQARLNAQFSLLILHISCMCFYIWLIVNYNNNLLVFCKHSTKRTCFSLSCVWNVTVSIRYWWFKQFEINFTPILKFYFNKNKYHCKIEHAMVT